MANTYSPVRLREPQRCKPRRDLPRAEEQRGPSLESLPGAGEGIEIMSEIGLDGRVGVHGQCEFALGAGEFAGSVQESLTNGTQAEEHPASDSGWQGGPLWRLGGHLQFAGQVVCEHAHERECSIGAQPLACDNIESNMLIGFAEELLLRTASVMEFDHVPGGRRFVGRNHRVLVFVVQRDEEVEL